MGHGPACHPLRATRILALPRRGGNCVDRSGLAHVGVPYTLRAMHLTKYYLDLVTESGEVFVWHWATLRVCGPVRLGHVSELAWRPRSTRLGSAPACESRWSSRVGPAPTTDDAAETAFGKSNLDSGSLAWTCPALDLAGCWTRLVSGPTLELLPESPGAIRWSCLHAASGVEVRRCGEVLRGHGYVERLDLTIAPWRLPIETLRWGRLVTASRSGVNTDAGVGAGSGADHRPCSVVWIAWDGPRTQRIVVEDGRLVPSTEIAAIDDDHVAWTGVQLELDATASLRDQPLCDALHGGLRWLGRALPRRLRRAREHRWLSGATLHRCRTSRDTTSSPMRSPRAHDLDQHGLAMHECVQFGAPA